MKKERDYHRMHHHRVAQEKNKLITDIKRIKTHYESFEPLVKTMKEKYEAALRDKVLNQLERERAVAELKSIKQIENLAIKEKTEQSPIGATQKRLKEYRTYEQNIKHVKNQKSTESEPFIENRHPKDSEFPPEDGLNPYLNKLKEDAHNITSLRLSQSIQAHNLPISR